MSKHSRPVDSCMILVYNCTRSVYQTSQLTRFDRSDTRFYGESQGLTVKGIISHGF